MRWTKVLTVGAAASLGFVAACGAPAANNGTHRSAPTAARRHGRPRPRAALEPERQGPGARGSPARRRAASSRCPTPRRPANMDPSDQFYQDTAVIFSLTHRALTTYVARDGKQVLVPGPRHRPRQGLRGRPDVDLHAQGRHQVRGRHPGQGRGRRLRRSSARSTHEELAANGPTYQREFFKDGDNYKGPYKR